MRLVFAGTPDVAVPALNALVASPHEVVAVITRPDARKGRGRKTAESPVKQAALEAGLPVWQPTALTDPEFVAQLRAAAVDCCPVVAYGGLVPQELLAVPTHGWVNLHFSLLPAWRGAAPVQRAIMAGDDVSGACVFQIEQGLDTGPVFATLTETIRPTDTAADLLTRLADAGAPLLAQTLSGIESGQLTALAQATTGVSHAARLHSHDAQVLWDRPAHVVDRHIRGCTPAPGAWSTFRSARVKLAPVRPRPELTSDPGSLSVTAGVVTVGTAQGSVELTQVQPAGKRMMPAGDWARGVRVDNGEMMGEDIGND